MAQKIERHVYLMSLTVDNSTRFDAPFSPVKLLM